MLISLLADDVDEADDAELALALDLLRLALPSFSETSLAPELLLFSLRPLLSESVFGISLLLVSTYSSHLLSKLLVNLAAAPWLPSTRSAEIEMLKSPPYEQIPIPRVPLPA